LAASREIDDERGVLVAVDYAPSIRSSTAKRSASMKPSASS